MRNSAGDSQISTATAARVAFFFSWLMLEILDEQIPPPEGRSNPRVIKKRTSKFPSKKPVHRGAGVKQQPLFFHILNSA